MMEVKNFSQVLNINEFTSARKCMSMVVRTPEGNLELYVKGADEVIFGNLREGGKYQEQITHHLRFFGVHGLRTLVFAKVNMHLLQQKFNCFQAAIDEEYYKNWNERFVNAQMLIKRKEAILSELATEIETNLELVGATAIEDRLQEGLC